MCKWKNKKNITGEYRKKIESQLELHNSNQNNMNPNGIHNSDQKTTFGPSWELKNVGQR